MPRRVIRERNGVPSTEVVWYYDEWCRILPDFWLEACGCRRCCEPGKLYERLPRLRERLERDKLVPVCKWNNVWWFVRLHGDKACLYPWPKRLYRRVF